MESPRVFRWWYEDIDRKPGRPPDVRMISTSSLVYEFGILGGVMETELFLSGQGLAIRCDDSGEIEARILDGRHSGT